MNKTAAIRSQARRAALTKVAVRVDVGALSPNQLRGAVRYAGLVDPANIPVIASFLGGAHLIDGAFEPDKERSTLGRIAQGVAGTGLAAGGIYLLGNNKARSAIRRAVFGLLGRQSKTAADRTPSMAKQAQIKLLAGAARAAGLRKALSSGKVVLPKAHSTKQLISEAVGGLRGERSLGWPLPAYPGRAGRDKGLRDLLDHLRATGTARAGVNHRVSEETLVTMLRRLNGTRSLPGPETAAAFRAGVAKPAPVGLDLTTLSGKGGKKTAEAAYAEGFCKAAETLGVDPVTLYKQAAPWGAIGKMVGRGMRMARSAQRAVQPIASRAMQMAPTRARNAMQTIRSTGQRYIDLMRGDTLAKWQDKAQNLSNLADKQYNTMFTAPTPAAASRASGILQRALRQSDRASRLAFKEQKAVDMSRYGTALGAAGVLGLAGHRRKPAAQPGTQPQGLTPAVRDPLGSDFANLGARYGW